VLAVVPDKQGATSAVIHALDATMLPHKWQTV
jgi:hypothetical protein